MITYFLRIDTSANNFENLNHIFEYTKQQNLKGFWEYKITESDSEFVGGIEHILNKLSKSISELKQLGISTDDMSFWYLYEYQNQCNMEFSPLQTKLMAELNLTLCISCWEN